MCRLVGLSVETPGVCAWSGWSRKGFAELASRSIFRGRGGYSPCLKTLCGTLLPRAVLVGCRVHRVLASGVL